MIAVFLVSTADGAPAIRHYRYTTAKHWLVQRGLADAPTIAAMKSVCQGILDSGVFAGRGISSADDFIFRTAKALEAAVGMQLLA